MATKALGILLLTTIWLFALFAVPIAQSQEPTETPTSGTEQPCAVGELCLDVGREVKPGQFEGSVNDPPGKYVRSIVTMAAIVVFLLMYLYVALSGKRLRIPFLSRRAS